MRKARYTKLFSIALKPEMYERIKKITDNNNESMGGWMRKALDKAISALKQGLNKKIVS